MTENSLQDISNVLAQAVEKVSVSVVQVSARRRIPASGTVIAGDQVLVANHTIEREEDIFIGISDGSDVKARLAGRDPGSELALLKVEGVSLTPAGKTNSPARVGQLALAVGRPGKENLQASLGIISAVVGPVRLEQGSLLERYYRTDAVPYPGFSGGPLVDSHGQVLGINSSGFAPGASVVIPADFAWQTGDSLNRIGKVRHGYLGIRSQPADLQKIVQAQFRRDQTTGLLLVGIEPESPAERAGLIVGDILVDLAGKPVTDHDALVHLLNGELVGQEVPVGVLRGGVPKVVPITIGERS
jgi:S1-C subfamily serine protease